jgi:ferritin
MFTKKMEKAFNAQVNAELYSAYLYLSMAAHFVGSDLPGFANWMRVQVQEEQFHAMKIYDYVLGRDGKVVLGSIDAPPSKWKTALEVFEETLKHEQKVTGLINDLVFLAREERDNASEIFLQWFVNEQVEEENNASTLIGQLKLIEGSPQALFLMDRELGLRVFTPPVSGQGGA